MKAVRQGSVGHFQSSPPEGSAPYYLRPRNLYLAQDKVQLPIDWCSFPKASDVQTNRLQMSGSQETRGFRPSLCQSTELSVQSNPRSSPTPLPQAEWLQG